MRRIQVTQCRKLGGRLNISGIAPCAMLMYSCTGKAKKAVSQSMGAARAQRTSTHSKDKRDKQHPMFPRELIREKQREREACSVCSLSVSGFISGGHPVGGTDCLLYVVSVHKPLSSFSCYQWCLAHAQGRSSFFLSFQWCLNSRGGSGGCGASAAAEQLLQCTALATHRQHKVGSWRVGST